MVILCSFLKEVEILTGFTLVSNCKEHWQDCFLVSHDNSLTNVYLG